MSDNVKLNQEPLLLDGGKSSSRAPTTATDLPHQDEHDNIIMYTVRPGSQAWEDSEELTNTHQPWVFRKGWRELLQQDTTFIFSNFGSLLNTAWLSITTPARKGTEAYNQSKISSIGEMVMLVFNVLLTVPVLATAVIALPTYLLIRVYAKAAEAFQGAPTRLSSPPTGPFIEGHEREAWIFVNGITAPPSQAQATASYLQALTGRPVVAILNRTLGAWFDLWECFMQRDMHLTTQDIREGYPELVKHVTNKNIERVVLIGHSQGGIIVSAYVDQLLTDFDGEVLSRVEVYTFASAANHFSRGGKYIVKDGVVVEAPHDENAITSNGPFRHVEHYCNSGDFVAQLGVLSHRPGLPGKDTYGVFAGQIFERNQGGHGILDYYLGLGKNQSSILDLPYVRSHSRFAMYSSFKDGQAGAGAPLPPRGSE